MTSEGQASSTLTAYGHSWVTGEAASDPSRGFVEAAARELGLDAINLGVGGSASAYTADNVSRQPAPESGAYVVMTGLNDARRYGDSPESLASYVAALRMIFDALGDASPAAPVVAVAQPRLLDYSLHAPHDRGSDLTIDLYNDRLRIVVERSPQVVLVAARGWNPAAMLAEDTVHPNDAGHAELARAVVRALRWRPVAGQRRSGDTR